MLTAIMQVRTARGWVEGLTIRVCEVDDAPMLVPLIAALAREEGSEPCAPAAMESVVRGLIESEASVFLLALRDHEPVGCLHIAWRPSTWQGTPYAYLEDVYVVPAVRGSGIGRQLLQTAFAHAERRGAAQIMLDVRQDNPAAQRLYMRLGFEDSGSIILKRAVAK